MARPPKCRRICSKPSTTCFDPLRAEPIETVVLGYDEYETVRLLDYEHFSQQQCAARMQVSRTTVTRMYEMAREKIADAFVNGKRILIQGGDVLVCTHAKPECADSLHCCHRKQTIDPLHLQSEV